MTQAPHIDIVLRWMPRHHGLLGNKCADEEAKRVAQGVSSPLHQLPLSCRKDPLVSWSTRQSHMKKVNIKSKISFESSSRYQHLCCIDPSMPSSKFRLDTMSTECWHTSMLVQLRTGYIPLQKHLHRIGCMDSPIFPACQSSEETVHHYLMTCLAHNSHRRQLENHLRRAAKSIRVLLTNPKAFPHLFRYIHDMKCFSNTAKSKQSG